MIQGLRSAIYPVADVAVAKEWYTKAFETEPYFDEPFYVGFEIGGFELGLIPAEKFTAAKAGSMVYWGVEDIEEETARLVDVGATIHGPIEDVGEGIRTVELADPFGNLLCLIENPQFDPTAVG